jgi:hypothetical protein
VSRVEIWRKNERVPFSAHRSDAVPNARVLLELIELAVANENAPASERR